VIKNSNRLRHALTEIYNNYFIEFDTLLDQYDSKYTLTENKIIAQIISDAIKYLDNKDYKLIAFCIMPNHVHLIIYQLKKPLFTIMKVLKGFTAREINKILHRKGQFWQSESYDNVIRSKNELHNKILYTLNNPVKAGLVNNHEDWPYSFCKPQFLEK